MAQPSTLSVHNIGDTGITPPKYLNSQEKILYESRPKWISIVGLKLLIWEFIISITLLPIAAVARGASGFVLLFWLFVAPLPLLVRTLRWRDTFYGLTDQRILKGSGVSGKNFESITVKRTTGLMDINTARVTGVTMDVPLAGRLFGYGSIVFQTSIQPMNWHGVKHPFEARRYVEETLSQIQDAAGSELAYREQIARTMAKIATEQKLGFLPQQAPYQVAGTTQATSPPAIPQPAALFSQPNQQLTLQCVKCGLSYAPGNKFCSQCGGPLQVAPAQVPLEA